MIKSINDLISLVNCVVTTDTAIVRYCRIPGKQFSLLIVTEWCAGISEYWKVVIPELNSELSNIKHWQQDVTDELLSYLFPALSTHWSSKMSSISTETESFSKHVYGWTSLSWNLGWTDKIISIDDLTYFKSMWRDKLLQINQRNNGKNFMSKYLSSLYYLQIDIYIFLFSLYVRPHPRESKLFLG